jgi:septal ring factor EnvC (AmiA/AmiB activator)
MAYPAHRADELLEEQKQLAKAEADIEQGWHRLRGQQDLFSELQRTGSDCREAGRLVQLMKQTLMEWEQHRKLIEQRIAYLEKEARKKSKDSIGHSGESTRPQ